MKVGKYKLIGAALLVLVIIGVASAYAIMRTRSDNSTISSNTATDKSTQSSVVKACDVLTKQIAEATLGTNNLDHPDSTNTDLSTNDISLSSCSYAVKASTGNKGKNTVYNGSSISLVVRYAKSPAGASSNRQMFASLPPNAQNVAGIGDKAFYSSATHQLDILKGSNWYTVTHSVGSAASGSLAGDKELAKKLQLQ